MPDAPVAEKPAETDPLADLQDSVAAIKGKRLNPSLRPVGDTEAFLARVTGSTDHSVAEFMDDDARALAESGATSGVIVEKTASALVRMYKLTENGSLAVKVPANAVAHCLKAGYRQHCFDCNTADCDERPNSCAGRPPRKYMRCPVCQKFCYDPKPTGVTGKDNMAKPLIDSDGDPSEILDPTLGGASTPQARIRSLLDEHMRYTHDVECSMYGIRRKSEIARG